MNWKPQKQNQFGEQGNCLSACLASLLNLPLTEVPNFFEACNWDEHKSDLKWAKAVEKFLADFGLGIMEFSYHPSFSVLLQGKYMVSGPSPRGYNHAVIYEKGRLVFDPHPEGGGLIKEEGVSLLYPILPTDNYGLIHNRNYNSTYTVGRSPGQAALYDIRHLKELVSEWHQYTPQILFAGSHKAASEIAKRHGWHPTQWKYISDVDMIRGLSPEGLRHNLIVLSGDNRISQELEIRGFIFSQKD